MYVRTFPVNHVELKEKAWEQAHTNKTFDISELVPSDYVCLYP